MQKFLTAKMTKENDISRVELAKTRVGLYSGKAIASLVREKGQAEEVRGVIRKVGLGEMMGYYSHLQQQ